MTVQTRYQGNVVQGRKSGKSDDAVVPTYHHGNLKQALLDKALAQLKEVGPDKLSLRALARDISVSQTAPTGISVTKPICWPAWLQKGSDA